LSGGNVTIILVNTEVTFAILSDTVHVGCALHLPSDAHTNLIAHPFIIVEAAVCVTCTGGVSLTALTCCNRPSEDVTFTAVINRRDIECTALINAVEELTDALKRDGVIGHITFNQHGIVLIDIFKDLFTH
jgi:hypothetical protein